MDLKNGYKVVYEKISDEIRTFYATKVAKCDPTVDTKLVEAEIGKYKLIYEKDGCIYGSESGIPANNDFCFDGFNEVFAEEAGNEPDATSTELEVPVAEPENTEHDAEPNVSVIENEDEPEAVEPVDED